MRQARGDTREIPEILGTVEKVHPDLEKCRFLWFVTGPPRKSPHENVHHSTTPLSLANHVDLLRMALTHWSTHCLYPTPLPVIPKCRPTQSAIGNTRQVAAAELEVVPSIVTSLTMSLWARLTFRCFRSAQMGTTRGCNSTNTSATHPSISGLSNTPPHPPLPWNHEPLG